MNAMPLAQSSPGLSPWPAALAVWGPGNLWAPHAHHSAQVSVALTGMLRVRTPSRPRWRSCQAILVPPDAEHEIDARGVLVLIAFFDPESNLAIPLVEQIGSAITPVNDDVVARWRGRLGSGQTLDAQRVNEWIVQELSDGTRQRRVHPGVQRVLEHLRRDHLDRGATSLTMLARVAHLSRSRLMHVFTESVGIPLRPYLLWLRVQRAACALTSGYTVTEAAHLAGFSDAPHLARSLRRTLGTSPRRLLRRVPEPKKPTRTSVLTNNTLHASLGTIDSP
jgi:AraC-like DNA-binding protein